MWAELGNILILTNLCKYIQCCNTMLNKHYCSPCYSVLSDKINYLIREWIYVALNFQGLTGRGASSGAVSGGAVCTHVLYTYFDCTLPLSSDQWEHGPVYTRCSVRESTNQSETSRIELWPIRNVKNTCHPHIVTRVLYKKYCGSIGRIPWVLHFKSFYFCYYSLSSW